MHHATEIKNESEIGNQKDRRKDQDCRFEWFETLMKPNLSRHTIPLLGKVVDF